MIKASTSRMAGMDTELYPFNQKTEILSYMLKIIYETHADNSGNANLLCMSRNPCVIQKINATQHCISDDYMYYIFSCLSAHLLFIDYNKFFILQSV